MTNRRKLLTNSINLFTNKLHLMTNKMQLNTNQINLMSKLTRYTTEQGKSNGIKIHLMAYHAHKRVNMTEQLTESTNGHSNGLVTE